ncbi:MAG: hypothetical protein OXG78_08685 [Chloroflexi bacterium]|nr:hypothetical protein [Chloroflexota bacterium]
MRSRILLCALVLMCLVPLVYAQDSDPTLCSLAELETVLSRQAAYQEVMDHVRDLPTREGTFVYINALLAWREANSVRLADFPACAESREMARLMDQISNDAAALEVFNLNVGFADVPQTLPMMHSYRRRDQLIEEIEATLASGGRQADYLLDESRYRHCNLADLEKLGEAIAGYHDLLAMADAIMDIDALVAYADAQIAWRESVWRETSQCELAWEFAFTMSRLTEDLFVFKGLELDGLSGSDNPYAETVNHYRIYLEALEDFYDLNLEGERERSGAGAQAFLGLPRCSPNQVESELERLRAYVAVGATEIETLEQLIKFSHEQIAWRAENITGVPLCAEQLEIQTLLIQLNGDFVTRAGLQLAAVPAEENPYLGLPGDQERVDALSYPDEAPATEHTQARVCTDAEKRAAISEDTAEYTYLLNAIRSASVMENFIAYLEDQIAWRDALWPELTLCAEVIELGLLMQQIHSGYASFLALHYAGATPEQNPFYPQIQADRTALQALTLAILQGARTDEPVADQAEGLPPCGSTAMKALFDAMLVYQNDLAGDDLNTLDDLLAYSAELIDWRESSLAGLPPCADVIKTRMLMMQLTGDFLARSALDIAGVAEADNPYYRLPSDRERLEAVGLSMLNADRAEAASEIDLPACSQSQVDRISDIIRHYGDSVGEDAFPYPYDQVPEYSDAYLAWRAASLSTLPPCADAVELGFALNEFSGDIATILAFYLAGADTDEIPQVAGVNKAAEELAEIIDRLGI